MSHRDAFDQLAHIGFVVRDIEKEVKRWVASGAKVFIAPEADPVQKVFCALVGYAGVAPFELIAPLPGENSPVETRLMKGGGLDHICYFVDDVGESVSVLENRGGLNVVAPVYGVVFDRTIAFMQMRTGLTIELMARKPERRKASDPLTEWFASDIHAV